MDLVTFNGAAAASDVISSLVCKELFFYIHSLSLLLYDLFQFNMKKKF